MRRRINELGHVMLLRVLMIILAPLIAMGATPAPDPAMQALVNRLASDDPSARQRAANDLLAKGRAARPALIEAMNGDDPQLRASASDLILKLPFDLPDHPPAGAGVL